MFLPIYLKNNIADIRLIPLDHVTYVIGTCHYSFLDKPNNMITFDYLRIFSGTEMALSLELYILMGFSTNCSSKTRAYNQI